MVEIAGSAPPQFQRVLDAFEQSFAGRTGMGAGLSVYRNGVPVIDLWGGVADGRNGKAWDDSTISVVFSCTKGLVSILAAKLVQEGRLDYAAPVSLYWPEFAQAGKEGLTIGDLLGHRAGLSAPEASFDTAGILEWSRVIAALEAERPRWPARHGHTYHALTHGWLAGEVIRRVAGMSVGEYFDEAVARPLGVSAWIGLPAEEAPRVAHLVGSESMKQDAADRGRRTDEAGILIQRALTLGDALPGTLAEPDSGFNDPRLWRAEIPGAGGITNARSMAKIWSATICPTDGVLLLAPETVAKATQPVSFGPPILDPLPPYSAWGMGFQLDSEARHYLSPASFGHDGAGGQVAFADPGQRIGFAFVTNYMEGPGDPRATSIIGALAEALETDRG